MPKARTPRSPAARTTPSPRGPADKADAIIEAALPLFVERGFHGTSVPEVAAHAGVGAGTIYRYFASKEALVNAIFQRFKQELTERVLAGLRPDMTTREQFRQLWTRTIAFALERPDVFAFLELHHHASYLDEASRRCDDRLMQLGLGLIESAQARGEISPMPSMLVVGLLLGAATGILRKGWEGKLSLTPELIAEAEQCAWEAIRARDHGARTPPTAATRRPR